MIILRGKNKGAEVKIHQWCNDWFMGEDGKIYSPTSIQLHPYEMGMVLNHDNNGILFDLFILEISTGKFKKRKIK